MAEESRTIIIGDIHGHAKALEQVLERSNFDFENDKLIQLGDVADGWAHVYECVEILLKVNWLIHIKGNHDQWFYEWLMTGAHSQNWLQGAHATAESYINHADRKIALYPDMGAYKTNLSNIDIPEDHKKFWTTQHLYYKDEDNNLFIHGGFNRHFLLNEQPKHLFYWDRDLWSQALSFKTQVGFEDHKPNGSFKIKEPVKEVFIGHTPTVNWGTDKPMNAANIWNLDTGGGYKGRLTAMDLKTKEYWQSDNVKDLYPDEKGR